VDVKFSKFMRLLWLFLALTLMILPLEIQAQSLSELSNQLDQENAEKAKLFSQAEGCPEGTEAVVRGIEVLCVKENTIQKTESNSQTNVELTDEQWGYVGIGVFIFIIIIAIIAKASQSKSGEKQTYYRDVRRRAFSNTIKDKIKELQNGRCKKCGAIPTHWNFDHVRGRGDNSIHNCQGLCLDCHQDKTLKDNR